MGHLQPASRCALPAADYRRGERSPRRRQSRPERRRKDRVCRPLPAERHHRYFFKLYALDKLLDLPAGASKSQLLIAMEGHILGQAELMGTYVRQK